MQEENLQLRNRLGMSIEKKPAQPVSTPFANGASVVNSKSSKEEKVKLFRSLFRGVTTFMDCDTDMIWQARAVA